MISTSVNSVIQGREWELSEGSLIERLKIENWNNMSHIKTKYRLLNTLALKYFKLTKKLKIISSI